MVGTYLDASTSHITKEDVEKLEESKFGSTCAPLITTYKEGFFLYAGDRGELHKTLENMTDEGYSEAFTELCRYAFQDLGMDLLRLDADGAVIGHLDVFDW